MRACEKLMSGIKDKDAVDKKLYLKKFAPFAANKVALLKSLGSKVSKRPKVEQDIHSIMP